MSKLKNIWCENKYDFYYVILIIVFYFILNIKYNTEIWHWEYWLLILISILIRYTGYKEGRKNIINALIKYDNNVCLTIKNDDVESIRCELNCIHSGNFFSLSSDENNDKYMTCGPANDEHLKLCWNLTKKDFEYLDVNIECILYRTKIIYVPIVKNKKG